MEINIEVRLDGKRHTIYRNELDPSESYPFLKGENIIIDYDSILPDIKKIIRPVSGESWVIVQVLETNHRLSAYRRSIEVLAILTRFEKRI